MSFIFSITCFSIGLIGIITTTIVSLRFRTNKILNIYLLVILLFTIVRIISLGYFSLIASAINPNNVTPFIGVIFPCIFLYFKNLIFINKRFNFTDLLHFIVPLLLGISYLFKNDYGTYSLHTAFGIFMIIGLFYIIKSFRLLNKHFWQRPSTIVKIDKQYLVVRNWTIFFFAICSLYVGRAIISIIVDLYLNDFSFGVRYFYFGILVCTIFYVKLLITPEILLGYNFFSEKVAQQEVAELNFKNIWSLHQNIEINNIQDTALKKKISDNIARYIKYIEEASIEKKLFRNEVLQIGAFAKQIGIPQSHLIYIFKYHSKKSFIEFKKVVRISDAIALIESNYLVNNTLESLAKKTGFSSYNTFFTSFREITGLTPRIYHQVYSKKIKLQMTMS